MYKIGHFIFLLTLVNVLLIGSSQAAEITIAVATNFAGAAQQLATRFEQTTGQKVQLVLGSTGKLYAQINNGAPFDIFFAADKKTPARLENEKKIIAGSRFTYAWGKLVLWSPNVSLIDNQGEVLHRKSIQHLAMANPKLAPYGLAAEQALKNMGLFDQLQTRLVRGENVGQTYQFIHTGAADLGFISLAQIIKTDKHSSGAYWLVPEDLYEPIEQQAVLLIDTKTARDFLRFVQSDSGKKIIGSFGYSLLDL